MRMAATETVTISSTKVNPLTRVIRHPPFSACTICWPSDKMEFIAMTGCLSGTNRHFGNFYRDFKGGRAERWFAPGAGAPTVTGGSSVLWWRHCRVVGPLGAKGWALVRTRGGCSYGYGGSSVL